VPGIAQVEMLRDLAGLARVTLGGIDHLAVITAT